MDGLQLGLILMIRRTRSSLKMSTSDWQSTSPRTCDREEKVYSRQVLDVQMDEAIDGSSGSKATMSDPSEPCKCAMGEQDSRSNLTATSLND